MKSLAVMLVLAGTCLPDPLACLSGEGAPQTDGEDPRSARVDDLFKEWHSPDSPGAAVLVLEQGEVVHVRGYGMANLEHGVRIRPNTVFDIASVSKQFGAFAVALLEAEGRIRFDDDIRTHVPEVPDFGHVITIRHLLHHTSGLRDWPGTLRMAGWDYQDVTSFEQILRMTYNQRELNFPPGEEYAYSNTGYNLLAELVQRVTGQGYREWTEENIFQPLGMHSTHFHDDHSRVVANRAESYRPESSGGYSRVVSSLTALASSSLFTTVEDLARWIRNFDDPVVGDQRVLEGMHQLGVLNSGDTLDYAFGLRIDEHRGLKRVSHGGSWAGYRTTLQIFPEEDFAVVVLANTAGMNAGGMGQQVAEIYLEDRLAPPPSEPDPPTPEPDPVQPKWVPSDQELAEYEGIYRSAELWTYWVLRLEGGELIATNFRVGDRTLTPEERDRFNAPGFGEVRFERDGNERIRAFTTHSQRIRNLRFDRVDSI